MASQGAIKYAEKCVLCFPKALARTLLLDENTDQMFGISHIPSQTSSLAGSVICYFKIFIPFISTYAQKKLPPLQ